MVEVSGMRLWPSDHHENHPIGTTWQYSHPTHFNREEGSRIFIRNVGTHLTDHTISRPRRQKSQLLLLIDVNLMWQLIMSHISTTDFKFTVRVLLVHVTCCVVDVTINQWVLDFPGDVTLMIKRISELCSSIFKVTWRSKWFLGFTSDITFKHKKFDDILQCTRWYG
jgi:hypothetical protein